MAATIPPAANAQGPGAPAHSAGTVGNADASVGERAGGETDGRSFEHALADAGAESRNEGEPEKEPGGDDDQDRLEPPVPSLAASAHAPAPAGGVGVSPSIRQASDNLLGPSQATGVVPAEMRTARHVRNPLLSGQSQSRDAGTAATPFAPGTTTGIGRSVGSAAADLASAREVAVPVAATVGVAVAPQSDNGSTATRGAVATMATPETIVSPGMPDTDTAIPSTTTEVDPGGDTKEPIPVRAAGAVPATAVDIDPLARSAESVAAPGAVSGSAISSASGTVSGSASTASASSAPMGAPLSLDGEDSHLALAATVRSLVEGGRTVARIDVTPADLGPLSIEVDRGPDRLAITVQATHPAARELLDALLPRLRESLMAEGFGEVRASVGDDARQDARQQAARDHDARDAGRWPGQSDQSEPGREDARERHSVEAASDVTDHRAGEGDVVGTAGARLRELTLDDVDAVGNRSLIDRWA